MQQAPSSLFSYVSLGGLIGSFLGFAAALVNLDVMSAGLESRVMWGIGAGILAGCILGYLVGSKSAKIATYKGAKNLSIVLVLALGLCSGLYVTWEMRTSGVRLSGPPAATASQESATVAQSNPEDRCKDMAFFVLIQDDYEPEARVKMAPILTGHIRSACEKFKCTPLEFVVCAQRVHEAMKKSSPESTLTLACNLIIGGGYSSLDRAVDDLVSVYSKSPPKEPNLK